MTEAPLLQVTRLHASYGAVSVLKGISLQVFPGEIVALIGANGAGKTTCLKALSRLLPITHGVVTFAGESLNELAAHQVPALGLAHVPEGRRVFSRLSVRDNLELGGFLRRVLAEDFAEVYQLFPILRERQGQLAGTLSGGEQQMLAIARALMSKPKMLLLDEPSMGVAPIVTERIFAAISQLNKQGMTVLLVEQNMNLALKLAHRAYVLETGEIILNGPAAQLAQDPRVREAYLGG